MDLLPRIVVLLIAAEHLYILWMEMFAWKTAGKKMLSGFEPSFFEETRVMAANQGLYNGFLSAGLIWSLLVREGIWADRISIFFLSCVIIAGVYGALTSSKTIFFKQALPAIAALFIVIII